MVFTARGWRGVNSCRRRAAFVSGPPAGNRWRGAADASTLPAVLSADDFHYALENTRVLLAPRRQIKTFGTTRFRFHLLTEPMDRVDEVRVRAGTIEAERPQLLTPEHYAQLLLEGFGEKARAFADWLGRRPAGALGLRYGFQIRRSEVVETLVRGEAVETVAEQLQAEAAVGEAPDGLHAIVQGVDDAWEVCLLKLTLELVQDSGGGNVGDLRRRGLL